MSKDSSQRFIFDDADIRGELVRLNQSYQDVLANQALEPLVANLLGEFMAACVLLSSTLKFKGRVSLQARSEGPVAMIMAEASNDYVVRAVANVDGAVEGVLVEHGLGGKGVLPRLSDILPKATMAITVEPENGQRYQGVIALEGDTLAECLEIYFKRSEQLQTRFWLAADGHNAGGFLLQALPMQLSESEDDRQDKWQHAESLAMTIKREELLELEQEVVLHRLYHEDPVRLLELNSVRFECSCSRQRTERALISLGRAELESILEEQGKVELDCQFCMQQYQFNAADIAALFDQPDQDESAGQPLH
jgi:molecular chaperone Hsp33